MFELMVEDSFDAAHQLRGYSGPCEKLHGHTFKVQVYLKAKKTGKLGYVIDFKKIRALLKGILEVFDHQNLNALKSFHKMNPTSENIAKLVFERLRKQLPREGKLSKVTVFESPTSSASYF
ncbi:MAG: 6-carboxytetrahydropterin synthase QueD [Candidatus Margulisiibacteriota bacterium]